ncbi:hypothetical protein HYV49_04700 [Candidatus Pacearchaeota archaeon]|nr:hypothetical protein [Candidatus Pacearchaeota archaeon]
MENQDHLCLLGMLIGVGMVAVPMATLSLISRRENYRRINEAETLYFQGKVGRAYKIAKEINPHNQLPFSLPKEVRQRARHLVEKIESELREPIETEVKQFLDEGLQFDYEISIKKGECIIYPYDIPLEEMSPTYNRVFVDSSSTSH